MTARLSVRFIAETVAEAFGTTYLRLVSNSKATEAVAARQVAVWLAWRHTDLTQSEIGQLTGGRSDVAILRAIERVEEKLAGDPAFAAEVETAEQALLAAAEALRRMAVDAPGDLDAAEVAERILSGRAVDVAPDALRALAMAALGQRPAPAPTPDVVAAGRSLLAALDRCNALPPGTAQYGRAAVVRTSAIHAFREALKPFAATDTETINGDHHVRHG